jgi:prevent-host-death family protein
VLRADAIHSLTDFQRNAKAVIERVRTEHQPVVITVNGEAAVVIQDAGDYQRQEDERQAVLAAIAKGEADIAAGRVRDFDEFMNEMESRYSG